MDHSNWQLSVPAGFRRGLARAWLLAAVVALLISGLLVILIVASRTPGIERFFPLQNFFRLAIVVHVDFSVLVWFACFGAMLWTLTCTGVARYGAWVGFALSMIGGSLLATAPFRPAEAIMSNYVPVLDSGLFLAGLSIFAFGILVSALHSLFNALPASIHPPETGVMRFGVHTSVIALVLAGGMFLWSLLALPVPLEPARYFESLFWGGGHVLQFAWVQFMLVTWLWLASAAGIPIVLRPRWVLAVLLAGLLPAFLAVWGYLEFEIASAGHRTFFIWLMAASGGLATGPMGLALVLGWLRSPPAATPRAAGLRTALLFSIALFALGGALGFMIEESNTMIPAHYHGCIVAITLAFMALTLHLLPEFGFAHPGTRLTRLLPWFYGPGQVLHVVGLAIAGGHGVQRKTAGAAQGLEGLAQVGGMAIMGLGGAIAITGGLLFLIAVARAVLLSHSSPGVGKGDLEPHHA